MFDPHPYEILEIDPIASNAEVLKAFAKAMQRKRYPPDVLAKARKALMDPVDRTIVHYLWGSWRQVPDVSGLNPEVLDVLTAEIDKLDRAMKNLAPDEQLTPELMQTEITAADQLFGQSIKNFSQN
jgi:diadenosine tetraphosphate (Ap4A) HIT family hydrolase